MILSMNCVVILQMVGHDSDTVHERRRDIAVGGT